MVCFYFHVASVLKLRTASHLRQTPLWYSPTFSQINSGIDRSRKEGSWRLKCVQTQAGQPGPRNLKRHTRRIPSVYLFQVPVALRNMLPRIRGSVSIQLIFNHHFNKYVLVVFSVVNSKYLNFMRIHQEFWKARVLDHSCSQFTYWTHISLRTWRNVFFYEASSVSAHFWQHKSLSLRSFGDRGCKQDKSWGLLRAFLPKGKASGLGECTFASALADGQNLL